MRPPHGFGARCSKRALLALQPAAHKAGHCCRHCTDAARSTFSYKCCNAVCRERRRSIYQLQCQEHRISAQSCCIMLSRLVERCCPVSFTCVALHSILIRAFVQNVNRDLPHTRELCATHPFSAQASASNAAFCQQVRNTFTVDQQISGLRCKWQMCASLAGLYMSEASLGCTLACLQKNSHDISPKLLGCFCSVSALSVTSLQKTALNGATVRVNNLCQHSNTNQRCASSWCSPFQHHHM